MTLKKLIFYFVVTVSSNIQARGPEATEAYNNALIDGKAFIKRAPIIIRAGSNREDKSKEISKRRKVQSKGTNTSNTDSIMSQRHSHSFT